MNYKSFMKKEQFIRSLASEKKRKAILLGGDNTVHKPWYRPGYDSYETLLCFHDNFVSLRYAGILQRIDFKVRNQYIGDDQSWGDNKWGVNWVFV